MRIYLTEFYIKDLFMGFLWNSNIDQFTILLFLSVLCANGTDPEKSIVNIHPLGISFDDSSLSFREEKVFHAK